MNIKKLLTLALGLISLTAVAQDNTAQEAQEVTHKYTDA